MNLLDVKRAQEEVEEEYLIRSRNMIKVELNKVKLAGTKCIILGELSTVIHTLFTAEEFDEEEVRTAIEVGMISEEELKKRSEELAEELKADEKLRGFKELLDTIFDGKDAEA